MAGPWICWHCFSVRHVATSGYEKDLSMVVRYAWMAKWRGSRLAFKREAQAFDFSYKTSACRFSPPSGAR